MSGPARSGRADSGDMPALGDLLALGEIQADPREPGKAERGLWRRMGTKGWPRRPLFQLFPPSAREPDAAPASPREVAATEEIADPSALIAEQAVVDPVKRQAPGTPPAVVDDTSPPLFRSAAFDQATQELLAAVGRRDRLVLLTGDAGSGTTTLCRSLIDLVGTRTFTAYVTGPFGDAEHLLRDVLAAFGVMSDEPRDPGVEPVQGTQSTRHELLVTLRDFLRSLQHLDAHATLFVDEAQTLSPELLQRVCALANIEADKLLLQVVLVGRPELRTMLASPELHVLDGRLTARSALAPLLRVELSDYVSRTARAGTSVPLDARTLDELFEATRGLPGLVDQALELRRRGIGEGPSSTEEPAPVESTARDTETVLPDLTLGQTAARRRVTGVTIALTAAAVALGGLAAWIFGARAIEILVQTRIR